MCNAGHWQIFYFPEKDIREWLKESIPETPKEPLRKETEDAEAAEEETMEQQTETTSGPTMQPNNLQTKRKSEVLASEAPEVGEQNDAAVEEGSEPRAQQRRRTEINEETPPSIGGAWQKDLDTMIEIPCLIVAELTFLCCAGAVVSVAKEVVLAAGGVAAAYLALQYFDVR